MPFKKIAPAGVAALAEAALADMTGLEHMEGWS